MKKEHLNEIRREITQIMERTDSFAYILPFKKSERKMEEMCTMIVKSLAENNISTAYMIDSQDLKAVNFVNTDEYIYFKGVPLTIIFGKIPKDNNESLVKHIKEYIENAKKTFENGHKIVYLFYNIPLFSLDSKHMKKSIKALDYIREFEKDIVVSNLYFKKSSLEFPIGNSDPIISSDEINELRFENRRLKKSLQISNIKIERYRKEMVALRKEFTKVTNKNAKLKEQIKNLKNSKSVEPYPWNFWTEEEEELLWMRYQEVGSYAFEEIENRTATACKNRLYKLRKEVESQEWIPPISIDMIYNSKEVKDYESESEKENLINQYSDKGISIVDNGEVWLGIVESRLHYKDGVETLDMYLEIITMLNEERPFEEIREFLYSKRDRYDRIIDKFELSFLTQKSKELVEYLNEKDHEEYMSQRKTQSIPNNHEPSVSLGFTEEEPVEEKKEEENKDGCDD